MSVKLEDSDKRENEGETGKYSSVHLPCDGYMLSVILSNTSQLEYGTYAYVKSLVFPLLSSYVPNNTALYISLALCYQFWKT